MSERALREAVAAVQARGWARLASEPAILRWALAARGPGLAAARDPAQSQWLRAGGTWFVGVHALPNSPDGAVGGVPLAGTAVEAAKALAGTRFNWDRAQVSICWRGYPKPSEGESAAAFRFRRDRDAAHLDGLHRGEGGTRHLREHHLFLLGLPLTEAPQGAAPLVAWEGSHRIMGEMLRRALADLPPDRWAEVDLAPAYTEARRRVFETCRRVALPVRPGQATLLHRFTLHGVAPWPNDLKGPHEGRAIAYFRPEAPEEGRLAWLMAG